MENRRLLFAAFLSALVLITWSYLFPPVEAPPRETRETLSSQNGESDEGVRSRRSEGQAGRAQSDRDRQASESDGSGARVAPQESLVEAQEHLIDFGADTVEAEIEGTVVLENESVRFEFSNRGAQLVSVVSLVDFSAEGQPLELVRSRGTDPFPYGLVVAGERAHRLNSALFEWNRERSSEGLPQVRFQYKGERGAAEKIFRLTSQGLLSSEVTVLGERGWSVVMGPGVRNLTVEELESRFVPRSVGFLRGEESETIAVNDLEEDSFLPARGLEWVTLEDNYFLTAIMPHSGVEGVVVRPVLQRKETVAAEPRFLPLGSTEPGTVGELLLLVESDGQQLEFQSLFGSKRYRELSQLSLGLEQTVRWGFFGFLARPLYFGLDWIYEHVVANYGWSIVLITFVIKLVFLPLTFKSQQSMGKMQELNPKVQAIRTKWRPKLKDKQGRPNVDAQRQMNEEVMKVYKTAGVNPASGCFPILLQMPVFFAFFRLLSTAVELRNASWLLWITDLSAPDPYYVLPVLMGVTSILLQKMMPAAPDPMQRRMMQLMPIMFMFFAFAFPSGLVVYWVTNNILTMGQQALTMKLKAKKKAQAAD